MDRSGGRCGCCRAKGPRREGRRSPGRSLSERPSSRSSAWGAPWSTRARATNRRRIRPSAQAASPAASVADQFQRIIKEYDDDMLRRRERSPRACRSSARSTRLQGKARRRSRARLAPVPSKYRSITPSAGTPEGSVELVLEHPEDPAGRDALIWIVNKPGTCRLGRVRRRVRAHRESSGDVPRRRPRDGPARADAGQCALAKSRHVPRRDLRQRQGTRGQGAGPPRPCQVYGGHRQNDRGLAQEANNWRLSVTGPPTTKAS